VCFQQVERAVNFYLGRQEYRQAFLLAKVHESRGYGTTAATAMAMARRGSGSVVADEGGAGMAGGAGAKASVCLRGVRG
jgi:hypothetical protein